MDQNGPKWTEMDQNGRMDNRLSICPFGSILVHFGPFWSIVHLPIEQKYNCLENSFPCTMRAYRSNTMNSETQQRLKDITDRFHHMQRYL